MLYNMNTWLQNIFTITKLNPTWQQQAIDATLADKLRAKAFAITPKNVAEVIKTRFDLFKSIYPSFSQFCQANLPIPPEQMLGILWDYWLPLGIKIASQRQQLGHSYIQGILGGQGTGKTTMCGVLKIILQQLGYNCLSLSLDDLYKTYSDRLRLDGGIYQNEELQLGYFPG